MKPKISAQRNMRNLLLNIFGFLLLWEWLRPLKVVTDTEDLAVFVVFIAICFLLLFLQVRFVYSALIKGILILYTIRSLYFENAFLDPTWIKDFLVDFITNIGFLFQANWWEMTPMFRSFLFFILLWLMSYLLHYWFTHQKRILLFFVLTIIYITVLDTFSPYDANKAIVRTVIIGFFMLGILQFERIKDQELTKHLNIGKKWAVPLAVFILFSTTIGYVSPKASPQWPDPVPFLKGYGQGNENGSLGGMKKIGYGNNDTNLGGPFIGDDTVVFTAETEKSHYWRVETKDMYTGKGWQLSYQAEKLSFNQENTVLNWYEQKTGIEELNAKVQMKLSYSHIVYPLGLTSVEADPDVYFSVDPLSEKIQTFRGFDTVNLQEYTIQFEQPKFFINELKEVTEPGGLEQNRAFTEVYTQLPERLPERVKKLALDITQSQANRYDKVKAVEDFFQQSSFVYDTQNVAVPRSDQDYVDQFLFDTQTGYCDNFSTSMVVLLRAAGIPSRWVKGYSQGEFISGDLYEITNNNAHSWVEVYFPEFGWVPFEPTKGFNNSNIFSYDLSDIGENPNNEAPQTEPKEMPVEESSEPETTPTEESTTSLFDKVINLFSWKSFFIFLLSVILLSYILFTTRKKWIPLLFIILYKRRKDEDVYFKAYKVLLKQLARVGMPRKEGQTLRDYALQVDKFYYGNDMEKLTHSYEKALYRKDNAEIEWQKSVELWENLIKKISS
ncbi:transglutaminaseTgpA domain-containing protein [Fredinandcohnia humi]